MELICTWCKEAKIETEFLRRNAAFPYSQSNVRCCKSCNSRRNRERYCDPGIRTKQLRANDKWRREHPERMAAHHAEFVKRNPAQQQARARVRTLLRYGHWSKRPCVVCGEMEGVEAHHDSYAPAHWEIVRWLCKRHHESWHQRLDPHKKGLLGVDLLKVDELRKEGVEYLHQIKVLRERYRVCMEQASALELSAWSKVMETAEPMFQRFLTEAS